MGQKTIDSVFLTAEELFPLLAERKHLFSHVYLRYAKQSSDVKADLDSNLFHDSAIWELQIMPRGSDVSGEVLENENLFRRGALIVRNMNSEPGLIKGTFIALLPDAIEDLELREECVRSFEKLRRQINKITKEYEVAWRKGGIGYKVRISPGVSKWLEEGGEICSFPVSEFKKRQLGGISLTYLADFPGQPAIW